MNSRPLLLIFGVLLFVFAFYHTSFIRPTQGGGVSGLLGVADQFFWLAFTIFFAIIYPLYLLIRYAIIKFLKKEDLVNPIVLFLIDMLVLFGVLFYYHISMVDIENRYKTDHLTRADWTERETIGETKDLSQILRYKTNLNRSPQKFNSLWAENIECSISTLLKDRTFSLPEDPDSLNTFKLLSDAFESHMRNTDRLDIIEVYADSIDARIVNSNKEQTKFWGIITYNAYARPGNEYDRRYRSGWFIGLNDSDIIKIYFINFYLFNNKSLNRENAEAHALRIILGSSLDRSLLYDKNISKLSPEFWDSRPFAKNEEFNLSRIQLDTIRDSSSKIRFKEKPYLIVEPNFIE